jgi:hypothetical protein
VGGVAVQACKCEVAVIKLQTVNLFTAANIKFKYDSEEEDDDDIFELHDNRIENGDHVPVHDVELDIE